MTKKIGIDVDGVLANFNDDYLHLLENNSEKYLCPTGPFLTWAKGNTVWDWDKEAGYNKEVRDAAWKEIHESDFWFDLQPLKGVEDDLERLEELAEDHFIYFITHRSGKQCKQQTEDWLFRYGISCPTVLISGGNKNPLIEGLELDFYIDDKLPTIENARELRQVGGLYLFLKNAPYNQCKDDNGYIRVNTVSEALGIYGI